MNIRLAASAALVLTMAVGAACAGESEPRAPAAHAGSGMEFPDGIAGFRRGKVRRFDEAGRDIGVDYDFHDGPRSIHATVFVYPAAESADGAPHDALARAMQCGGELDRRPGELATFHPDSTLSMSKAVTLVQNGSERSGYRIDFNSYEPYGQLPQNVSSTFYLFCFAMDDWMLSYRFTWPAKTEADDPIAQFMRDLPWAR